MTEQGAERWLFWLDVIVLSWGFVLLCGLVALDCFFRWSHVKVPVLPPPDGLMECDSDE